MSERPSVTLSPAVFSRLAELLAQKAGLQFSADSHFLFERRIGERLGAMGISDFETYLEIVGGDVSELDALFEIVTTKETYFDRQDYQLRSFASDVIPSLVKNLGDSRRLTVWSAGCSTGEEAYTIAMYLLESPLLSGYSLQVIGTDLCASNIEFARRAEYRQSSFRVISEERLGKYFTPITGGYRACADLRKICHFSRANLIEAKDVRSVGRVDAIFCRNVIIYFHEKARKIVTDLLFERLLPGGVLMLGHTESLLNADTPFEVLHLDSDIAYRRPIGSRSSGGTR